jgi:hypothetical protein
VAGPEQEHSRFEESLKVLNVGSFARRLRLVFVAVVLVATSCGSTHPYDRPGFPSEAGDLKLIKFDPCVIVADPQGRFLSPRARPDGSRDAGGLSMPAPVGMTGFDFLPGFVSSGTSSGFAIAECEEGFGDIALEQTVRSELLRIDWDGPAWVLMKSGWIKIQ